MAYVQHYSGRIFTFHDISMESYSTYLNPHKQIKEDFVSNLNGTSILEIAALTAIMPVLILLRQWNVLQLRWDQGGSTNIQMEEHGSRSKHLKDWRNYASSLIVDFFLVVLPMLSCLTIMADQTYICSICLMLLVLFRIFYTRLLSHSGISTHTESSTLSVSYWRKSLSSYRFAMMLVTCLSILAVDFKIFPRRFAKTETYGTGLMDLGVGSFVVANALVSKQARNIDSVKRGGILKSVSPLLLIGFARMVLTKGVDYQVHVGEYGVHWNFFFTLAAVAIVTSIINIHPQYCGFFGCAILTVYQAVLLCGLNRYLISDQRGANIVSLNKEGIFSLFGYWGLYLVSVNLGYHLFFLKKPISSRVASIGGKSSIAIEVWLLDGFLWVLTIFLDKFVEKISRRMCNLAYVTFVLAQNFEVLGMLMLSDLVPTRKSLVLEEVFDQNMLVTFLLANILTGLVNVSMTTVFVSPFLAYCILLLYAVVLISGVAVLKFQNLRLKFW